MSICAEFARARLYTQRPGEGGLAAQKEYDRGFYDGMYERPRNPPEDATLRDSYDAGYDAGTWKSGGGNF
jgi:hypothetical protein